MNNYSGLGACIYFLLKLIVQFCASPSHQIWSIVCIQKMIYLRNKIYKCFPLANTCVHRCCVACMIENIFKIEFGTGYRQAEQTKWWYLHQLMIITFFSGVRLKSEFLACWLFIVFGLFFIITEPLTFSKLITVSKRFLNFLAILKE